MISLLRFGCAIPLSDHVILTGGDMPYDSKVVKYNKAGWVEDLPSLLTGRKNHGCSHYTDTSGQLVRGTSQTQYKDKSLSH